MLSKYPPPRPDETFGKSGDYFNPVAIQGGRRQIAPTKELFLRPWYFARLRKWLPRDTSFFLKLLFDFSACSMVSIRAL